MIITTKTTRALAAAAILAAIPLSQTALADAGHGEKAENPMHMKQDMTLADAGHGDEVEDRMHMMEEMMEEHQEHEHGHKFEAMKDRSPEHMRRDMEAMMEMGLAMPPMDSERGRELFLEKGCVACHAVNGVGGEMGPSFNAIDMPNPMNAFEFAARMWRGAAAMTDLQTQLFGEPISLTGQELADIVAFAHDEQAQAKLSADQIPEEYRELIGR